MEQTRKHICVSLTICCKWNTVCCLCWNPCFLIQFLLWLKTTTAVPFVLVLSDSLIQTATRGHFPSKRICHNSWKSRVQTINRFLRGDSFCFWRWIIPTSPFVSWKKRETLMKKSLTPLRSAKPKPKPSPPLSLLTQQPKRQKLRGCLLAASEALLLSIFNHAAYVLGRVSFVCF